jgi:hypothetical protein
MRTQHGIPKDLPRNTRIFAIRGPNCFSEFCMYSNLQQVDSLSVPLIGLFLHGKTSPAPQNLSQSALQTLPNWLQVCPQALHEIFSSFRLNSDQQQVLSHCSEWLTGTSSAYQNSIVLSHGVFGSGKSYMLVALLIFFIRVLDQVDPQRRVRILITSQTNVAVDNVLLGLLSRNCDDFARVGSVRKIAKPLLSYVLHSKVTPFDLPNIFILSFLVSQ